MGDKYRFPFVLDGRAEALAAAGADADNDLVAVLDASEDATKTMTLAELGAAGGAGWIPAPEAPQQLAGTVNPNYTVQAADAGLHRLFTIQAATQTASGTQFDFDLLPDGEWFHATFAVDDDSAGTPEVLIMAASGTNQFEGWGSPGGITSYGGPVLSLFAGSGVTVSFYNDGGDIKVIGPNSAINLQAQAGP
jgi:hypothetical protein